MLVVTLLGGGLLAALCMSSWFASHPADTATTCAEKQVDEVLRETPVSLRPSTTLFDAHLQSKLETILALLEPHWEYRRPSNLLHALRLWGPGAVFPTHAPYPVPESASAPSSDEMLSFFLNQDVFQRRHRGMPYFFKSPYGVGAGLAGDVGTAAHEDDFLHVAAEIGLPAATLIRCSGQQFTVRDVFAHTFQWFHLQQELEFTAVAFALYLAPGRTWTNRFGETYSLDQVAESLITRDLEKCVCYGTHVPYALAVLLAVNEQEPILSDSIRRRIEERLKQFATSLVASQGKLGGWNGKWTSDLTSRARIEPEELEWIRSTGHHLEWIALARRDLRPPDESVQRAVTFLSEILSKLNTSDHSRATNYNALSHAARALVLLSGKRFATEAMIDNWSKRDVQEVDGRLAQ